MGFMDSYKRLEKLCGEILNNDRRVSAYIDEMNNMPRGIYIVRGWENDLKQLKHYRWVRNQIAHNPDCTEENMCDASDAQWLADFRSRIVNQTDPLTLYRKATQPQNVIPKKIDLQPYPQKKYSYYRTKQSRNSRVLPLLITVASIILMVLILVLVVIKFGL